MTFRHAISPEAHFWKCVLEQIDLLASVVMLLHSFLQRMVSTSSHSDKMQTEGGQLSSALAAAIQQKVATVC